MKEAVAETLAQALQLDKAQVASLLEVPPDPKLGDYALPCFAFAKERKQPPQAIAGEFARVATGGLIAKAEAAGPYLNLHLDRGGVAERVVPAAREESYGTGSTRAGKVMVEYSQPNTHKGFHVGHLRGTSMGEALARILRYAGYDVVQANYSGDTGMHVAKWLWCYRTHHAGEEPPKNDGGRWLASIYVDAIQRLEKEPERQEEVDEVNRQLDEGSDEELLALWRETRQWSIDELERIYEDLDAHFDEWFFEREMEPRAKEVSRQLLDTGIAKQSEGAIIVDLEEHGLSVWVLLRKDGTPLYSAKDLALAERKFEKYHIDKSVYVVAKDQELHFKQLFKTLELMGFAQAAQCEHLCYEMVRLPDGKMSSRTGRNILYADLRDEVFGVAGEEIRKRHPDWPTEKLDATVKAVAVCAMKFEMIQRDINKTNTFDARRVCDFEGDTGPYVQYTHARCNSILAKLGREPSGSASPLGHDAEYRVVRMLAAFPETVARAAEGLEPAALAKYALDLAKAFNSFYHECRVVGDEQEDARALLVDAVRRVLARSLELLGIEAPREM